MAAHVEGKEYDLIFAGGGLTACVIAGRLAKANPSLSILIIERGRSSLDDPLVSTPGMLMTHFTAQSASLYPHPTNASEALNGRAHVMAAPNKLGGGSSINMMMYTRGSPADYDAWDTEGWDFESLKPYAKRLETFHPNGPGYNMDVHGTDGPIHVSHGPKSGDKAFQEDLLAAYKTQGLNEVPDVQDFETADGSCRWARYIGPDGKRSDVATAYLQPLIRSGNHPNLHILLDTVVGRVLFTGTHASGVECEPTANMFVDPAQRKPGQTIRAKKLVVVSAGTLGTSSILERSGVGCADRLRKLDIPVVADLPGVGESYQDHHLTLAYYTTDRKIEDSVDYLHPDRMPTADALASGNPCLLTNGIDIGAKFRPTDAEVASLGPDFLEAWDRDFKHQPTKPLAIIACLDGWLGRGPTPSDENHTILTVAPYTLYPYSRGDMHVVSRDPRVPASFNTGFLSSELDVKVQVLLYKRQREIARRTNVVVAEYEPVRPAFHPDSPAFHLFPPHMRDKGPGGEPRYRSAEERARLPPIEYSAEDDAAIEAHVHNTLVGMWHSMGLAKMAPREKRGVVDPRLNVYGTTGLKLADLSICPGNVGANTANTAFIIGETAADIIAQDLGFVLVL